MPKYLILPLLALALLMGGCWDRVEIEDRGYVLGLAFDLPKEDHYQRKLTITMPFAEREGGKSGGGQEMPNLIFDVVAPTVESGMMLIQNRINRKLFFGHQKVIIFSEKSAKLSILPWLDFFERFSTVPRTTLLAVAKGDAGKVLLTAPDSDPLPSIYLSDLLEETARYGFGPKRNLNKVVCYMESRGPGILIPLIEKEKENVQVTGSAVFRGNSLVGTMDKFQTRGALWLTGEVERGTITLPRGDGNQLSFELKKARRQVRPRIQEHGITFEYKLVVEGTIEEYFGRRNIMDLKEIAAAEKALAQVINEEIQSAIKILQQRLATDALGLGMMIRKHNPKLWDEIGDWNQYFAQHVSIQIVDLSVFIRRTGVLR